MLTNRKHLSLLTAALFLIQITAAAPLSVEVQKLFGATVGNDTTVTSSSVRYYETPQGFSVFGGGDGIIQPGEQVTAEVTTGVECSTDICVIDFWIKTESGTYFDDDNPHFVGSGEEVTADINFEAPSETGSYLAYWYSGVEEHPDQGQMFDYENFFVEKDSDGDGITDRNDDCPDQAGEEEYNGCPPPDSDGDGVPDDEDECPEIGISEYGMKDNGCPIEDSDGDGIPDPDDDCPDQPGPSSTNGCPDSDGDGIPDGEDDCPSEAGPEATDGCPDTDGDGVADINDEFPDDPSCVEDSDGDGVCDAEDEFPNDADCVEDSDGDGACDAEDEFPHDPDCIEDSDGDGVCDSEDVFPNDPGKQADRDGDGIADSVDQCIDRSGPERFDGCPDSDGDGVPDDEDDCPDTDSSLTSESVDSNGCAIVIEDPENGDTGDGDGGSGDGDTGDDSDDRVGTELDQKVFSILQNLVNSITKIVS